MARRARCAVPGDEPGYGDPQVLLSIGASGPQRSPRFDQMRRRREPTLDGGSHADARGARETGRAAGSGAVGGRRREPRTRSQRPCSSLASQRHFDRCTIAAALASHRRPRGSRETSLPASCTRRPECVIDLVRNLRSITIPHPAVLLYDGGERAGAADEAISVREARRAHLPGAQGRMRWGYLHGFALDCMRFALGRSAASIRLTIVDSGPARHAQPGYSAHVGAFLAWQATTWAC